MKHKLLLTLALAAVAAVVLHAANPFTVPTQALRTTAPVSQDLLVTNANNTVGVTVNKSSASVSKLLSLSHAGTAKFTVETNGAVTSASLTATTVPYADASKVLVSSAVTPTELGYLSGVTSALQTQLAAKLPQTNGSAVTLSVTGLTVNQLTNNGLTASLPVFSDANKMLVTKSVANTLLALGIQSGSVTSSADGTFTNTFSTAFSAAPKVIITPVNSVTATQTVVSASTTAFIGNVSDASVVVNWIAIGTP
ncbi:MAG: Uncharacterized protein FD161_2982 [Limisphaerales bacterium]|nr:MAG: Uncharacterized protein FD161_2982 [Limisphaerales bacterium]KAG0508095.1 MAG: Uncharacterized protein E1N63_2689 [Limisphaerales bacterium]TXT53052.1 MAG: Uncharacterized protein FD140_160 [Limisphaerales bacterium]